MAFDPAKYLSETSGFDPNAYLGIPTAPQEQGNPVMDKLKALYEVPTTVVTSAVAPF